MSGEMAIAYEKSQKPDSSRNTSKLDAARTLERDCIGALGSKICKVPATRLTLPFTESGPGEALKARTLLWRPPSGGETQDQKFHFSFHLDEKRPTLSCAYGMSSAPSRRFGDFPSTWISVM